MSSTVVDLKKETPFSESNGANGAATTPEPGWPVPEFKHNLGDNPLWQALMDEIEANRQADITEANWFADMESEK